MRRIASARNSTLPGALLVLLGATVDLFLQANRDLNARLQKMGIQHYYIEAKGRHDAPFENEAFQIMFRFFDNYFRTGVGSL
jgi:S-formylglutathione hydrolase FrmB